MSILIKYGSCGTHYLCVVQPKFSFVWHVSVEMKVD